MRKKRIILNIDGREVFGLDGQTILEAARENGIEIPTLCHDDRLEIYGSCGICAVEVEGNPKLLRSCSTLAADGMVISTNTPRARQNRKAALELLLSDHTGDCRAPCTLACPAQTDCQGYIKLIASGAYNEALELIRNSIPLPASIGRVCPRPCEEACRRELVEEPISIAALKRFAGDVGCAAPGAPFPTAVPTGKKIAVIGGGPGGLTAAYFLRKSGHEVTVYDAMPQMGGMLRYGIPEYRLPKGILQREIDNIEAIGVVFRNKIKIGRDLTLKNLQKNHDAVIVAAGAWSSVNIGCPGEELEGVISGIDFLRNADITEKSLNGRKVAVVGGGNTAMDACRTAVRLGAAEVYNIYRRTKNEMPADKNEITEAEDEGVIFKNLTNPIEIIGKNGRAKAVRLQVMELGEPDASGRRRPVPVSGKEEFLMIDTLITAIGQKLDNFGLEALEQTKWGTLAADEHTFCTNLNGVFAVGDAANNGADIAVAAIGEAKRAAEMMNKYLNGEPLENKMPYLVKTVKTAEDFADKATEPGVKPSARSAVERRNDFMEISPGLTEDEAKKEASRCLECGCQDYFDCKLIKYAGQYDVQPEKYEGRKSCAAGGDIPNVCRTPEKCILCGQCVRLCEEIVGAGVLGFVGRGFDTSVQPMGGTDECASCGQCADICPTGALVRSNIFFR